jgi:hypothetical protein
MEHNSVRTLFHPNLKIEIGTSGVEGPVVFPLNNTDSVGGCTDCFDPEGGTISWRAGRASLTLKVYTKTSDLGC